MQFRRFYCDAGVKVDSRLPFQFLDGRSERFKFQRGHTCQCHRRPHLDNVGLTQTEAMDGAARLPLEAWYFDVPIVTRAFITASVLTSIAVV